MCPPSFARPLAQFKDYSGAEPEDLAAASEAHSALAQDYWSAAAAEHSAAASEAHSALAQDYWSAAASAAE